MPLLRGSSVKLLPFRAPLKIFVSLVANQRESRYGNGPGAHEATRGGVFRSQGVGLSPRYLRGTTKEGGHLLPWRPPAKTLPGTVIEKRVDTLELPPTDSREGRLFGMEPAD